MFVLIMPTIESICEDYGFDYYDDSNTREVLEQQGQEAYPIEVNDGETFEIPEGFIGRINQDEQTFYKKVLVDEDMDYYEKEEIQDDLPAGLYQLDQDEINLIMNIQEKLQAWAKETVNCYLEQVKQVGEDIARSFYNQSDLSRVKKCELMIIGINPGCGCRFSEWSLKDKISSDFLYKGNPCFNGMSDEDIIYEMTEKYDKDKRRNGWDLWHKIHKILNYAGKGYLVENLDKFVLSNMVFFGTTHEGQIPKEIDQEKCAEKTLELMDLLKPKVVLLFGDQCKLLFKKVAKITHMEEIVPGYHVFYCFYKNRHIIAIYHTAYYRYYTDYNMKVIGSVIGYALDNSSKRIDKEQLNSYLVNSLDNPLTCYTISRIDKKDIVQQVISSINLEAYEEKNHRYKLSGKYGITITDTKEGYIAIRHIKYDYKGYTSTQDKEVLAIKDMLKGRNYNISVNAWIGTKKFAQFGNNDNDIIEGICKEIKELKEDIYKI